MVAMAAAVAMNGDFINILIRQTQVSIRTRGRPKEDSADLKPCQYSELRVASRGEMPSHDVSAVDAHLSITTPSRYVLYSTKYSTKYVLYLL